MTTRTLPRQHTSQPQTPPVPRAATLLAASYLTLSTLTLAAAALLRHHPALVTTAVWTRASIVTASAALTLLLTTRAVAGSRRAFRRVQIITPIMLTATILIIALPDAFPLWLKIEQTACALLLAALTVILHSSRRRSRPATR